MLFRGSWHRYYEQGHYQGAPGLTARSKDATKGLLALLLGARTLLGALLALLLGARTPPGAPYLTTRSKDAF